MRRHRTPAQLVAAALAAHAAVSLTLLWAAAAPMSAVLQAGAGAASFDALMAVTAAGAALAVATWLLLGVVLTALVETQWSNGRRWLAALAARVTPTLVARIATGLLAGGIVGGPAMSGPAAFAETRPINVAAAPADTVRDSALRSWTADRPSAGREHDRVRTRHPAPAGTVVVRRGDSLWVIAARHLPARTGHAAVARAWPRWYAANRDVVGSDPDLIRPGQRLRAPRS